MKWQQPIADRRIGFDINLASRCIDEKQILALDAPTFDVLAAQKRFQQFRRFRIGGDEPIVRRTVDDEGFVETRLDAVERRPIDLAERLAPCRDLVAQPRQRIVLETPGAGPEPCARHGAAASRESAAEIVRQLLLDDEKGEIARAFAFLERKDRRIGGHALENLNVAEIDDAFDPDAIGEEECAGSRPSRFGRRSRTKCSRAARPASKA